MRDFFIENYVKQSNIITISTINDKEFNFELKSRLFIDDFVKPTDMMREVSLLKNFDDDFFITIILYFMRDDHLEDNNKQIRNQNKIKFIDNVDNKRFL